MSVLPFCHELRELSLYRVEIPPLACDVDLPLVHTLQKLSLTYSTLAWMDGLVFPQLQKFVVDEYGWPERFKRKVGMPACSHIVFRQSTLKSLPVLQSDFHLPFLETWELVGAWSNFEYVYGFSALQRVHAKRFKFHLNYSSKGFLELLGSKDEVERLDLLFQGGYIGTVESAWDILIKMSVTNYRTMKVPCPDMKVLVLQFDGQLDADKERFSRLCRQMMNNRRLAGYSLEKCYIWWRNPDRQKAAPFVLITENEEVRTEE